MSRRLIYLAVCASVARPLLAQDAAVAPPVPEITATSPATSAATPSRERRPVVSGKAGLPSSVTVKIYSSSSCTGTVLGQGAAAATGVGPFSFSLEVALAPDGRNDLYAASTNAAGLASLCTTVPFRYYTDNTPPAAPSSLAFAPPSPSAQSAPKITGTAESGATVVIYRSADCSGGQVASGTAASFASPGISITATSNATSTFSVAAFDSAGNKSACSPAISYVHVVATPTPSPTPPPTSTPTPRPTSTPAASPSISGLTLGSASVRSGGSAEITVTLASTAPSDAVVALVATIPCLAPVPASVTIPAGQFSKKLSFVVGRTTADSPVTITAAYFGTKRSATLTVTP